MVGVPALCWWSGPAVLPEDGLALAPAAEEVDQEAGAEERDRHGDRRRR